MSEYVITINSTSDLGVGKKNPGSSSELYDRREYLP